MIIHEMTPEECRAALGKLDFGRLACVRDNQPYLVPVHFAFDEPYLYGITTAGQKIEWMRSNPLVCLQADERPAHNCWLSIIVFGRYQELSDSAEYAHARGRALELLEKRTMWWEPACVPVQRLERRQPIFYRIHIDNLTGRRATPDSTQ